MGLYRYVRHPNYLGELLFHLGYLLAGASAAVVWWQIALAAIAPVSLMFVILGATRTLAQEQQERYGQLPEYRAYRDSVPPLVGIRRDVGSAAA